MKTIECGEKTMVLERSIYFSSEAGRHGFLITYDESGVIGELKQITKHLRRLQKYLIRTRNTRQQVESHLFSF